MKIAAVAVTATCPVDQETQSLRMVKLFALNRTLMKKILILHYQVFFIINNNDNSNTYYIIICNVYFLFLR